MIRIINLRHICTSTSNSTLKLYYLYFGTQFRCCYFYKNFTKYSLLSHLWIGWKAPFLGLGIFTTVLITLCCKLPFTYLLMDSSSKNLNPEIWDLYYLLLYLKNRSTVPKTRRECKLKNYMYTYLVQPRRLKHSYTWFSKDLPSKTRWFPPLPSLW